MAASRFTSAVLFAAMLLHSPNLGICAEHPISMTEAQIFVTRNNARARIALYAEDLFMFHNLQPDDTDMLPPSELQRGLEAHKKFLLQKFTIRDTDGETYEGRVTNVQPFEIPDEGISVEELMLHTATYELEYPFSTPPEFLTLQQDISDENFIVPSEMKLTLHQAGTELTYTEVLKPGGAQTLRFDWSAQALSEESSDEEWEAWFEKQREATLGITSYSSVYSFIYVEPAEVRHEILIPLASLKTILPLEHADPSFIEIDEQDGVRALIQEWLTDQNPTEINGVPVAPEFTRIDFHGLDLKDFAKQAQKRRVSLANGRVGIILTYPAPAYPVRQASLEWSRFHSTLRKIQSVVFAYPEQMERFEFSRFNEADANVFRWKSEASIPTTAAAAVKAEFPRRPTLTIPLASIFLLALAVAAAFMAKSHAGRMALAFLVLAAVMIPFAGYEIEHPFRPAPTVSAERAADVFQRLHSGAYQALDFGTEERIYEELEHSIDGELLETVYLQLREGLQVREQGGAVARVRSVDYVDGDTARDDKVTVEWPGFRFRSRWTVSGTVEHWGHIHERQNQFCAVFNVEPKEGYWKITDMRIEDQQSVASNIRLRKF